MRTHHMSEPTSSDEGSVVSPSVPEGAEVTPETITQTAPQLLTYVPLDLSLSMSPYLGLVRQAFDDDLLGALRDEPLTAEVAQVGFVGFNDDAFTLAAPARIADPQVGVPELVTGGTHTNFSPPFVHVRDEIEREVSERKANGERLRRPSVWFITDGCHNGPDDWQAARDALVDPTWAYHPNLFAIGIGDADRDQIARIPNVEGGAYFQADGARVAETFSAIAQVLVRSIIAQSTPNTAGTIPAQSPPPGLGQIDLGLL